jgi:hypothetical protein
MCLGAALSSNASLSFVLRGIEMEVLEEGREWLGRGFP